MNDRDVSAPGARDWDAVVVGGGPAGAAAAITLARAGRSALLVERRAAIGFKLGESLPPQARPLAEGLLAGTGLDEDAAFPVHGNVSCWGRDEPAVHDFFFTPHGHGLRLDRPRFDRALRRSAGAAGAEVLEDAKLDGVTAGGVGGGWRLAVAHGGATLDLSCRALVDATGRSAWVARRFSSSSEKARVLASGDRLFAFARVYALDAPADADSDGMTRVEAAADGWWYTAVLPSRRRLVVFHTDRDLPAARAAAGAAGFERLLAASRHVGPLLAGHGYRPLGRPRGAAAGGQRLDRFSGRRGNGAFWLAAGDAAQAFDPLSSQGIRSALESGCLAGDTVARMLAGDNDALARYDRALEAVQTEYQRQYRHFYGSERRFAQRPFWQRRLNREQDVLPPAPNREESSCVSAPSVP